MCLRVARRNLWCLLCRLIGKGDSFHDEWKWLWVIRNKVMYFKTAFLHNISKENT